MKLATLTTPDATPVLVFRHPAQRPPTVTVYDDAAQAIEHLQALTGLESDDLDDLADDDCRASAVVSGPQAILEYIAEAYSDCEIHSEKLRIILRTLDARGDLYPGPGTVAQRIAAGFQSCGTCWTDAHGLELHDVLHAYSPWPDRDDRHDAARWNFSDGSSIVIAGDCWDFGHDDTDCQCLGGGGHSSHCYYSDEYDPCD